MPKQNQHEMPLDDILTGQECATGVQKNTGFFCLISLRDKKHFFDDEITILADILFFYIPKSKHVVIYKICRGNIFVDEWHTIL